MYQNLTVSTWPSYSDPYEQHCLNSYLIPRLDGYMFLNPCLAKINTKRTSDVHNFCIKLGREELNKNGKIR